MRLLLPPLTVAAWNRRPLEAPSRDPPPLPTRVRCRSRVDRIGGGTGVSVGVVVSARTCRVLGLVPSTGS